MIEVNGPHQAWKGSSCNACGERPHTTTVSTGYGNMGAMLMLCDECRRELWLALETDADDDWHRSNPPWKQIQTGRKP